jgi:putative membrane protein
MTFPLSSPFRTALIATGIAAAFGAGAADNLAGADKSFVMEAASGGLTEVELGKLAEQKASNAQVKQFGSRMVQDHSKANDELKQVASNKGVQLPAEPDSKHQRDIKRLQGLSGTEFDRAYITHMVADHKKDVSDFQKEAKSGKDADVKAFAAKTLPTLQEHLKMAQDTESAVKAGATKTSSAKP